jgi:hypothetical protein
LEEEVRRLAGLKRQPDPAEDVNKSMGELIDKLSTASIAQVEKLISDLQAQCNYMKAEGDRIQQDMARYAHLTDTALASAKIISESLGQWRKEPSSVNAASESSPGQPVAPPASTGAKLQAAGDMRR